MSEQYHSTAATSGNRPVAEVLALTTTYTDAAGEPVYNPNEGMCVALAAMHYHLDAINKAEYNHATHAVEEFMEGIEGIYRGPYLADYVGEEACYSIYQNWERRHEYI